MYSQLFFFFTLHFTYIQHKFDFEDGLDFDIVNEIHIFGPRGRIKRLIIHFSKQEIFKSHLTPSSCSFMMTVSQDIFNKCITCFVYEVRRKGIIYSKTYFSSLFTSCLGIKVRVTKVDIFFAKVSNSF